MGQKSRRASKINSLKLTGNFFLKTPKRKAEMRRNSPAFSAKHLMPIIQAHKKIKKTASLLYQFTFLLELREMLTENEEQLVPNYETRNTKRISNTVLKMPISFSPFFSPLKNRQVAITSDCQNIEESIKESLSDMPPLILTENQRKTKKLQKKEVIRSRRKTMLQIVKTINTEGAEGKTERRYVVMCRYGNEAHTFTQVVSEAYLLQKDPELLIELLTNAKRTSSS